METIIGAKSCTWQLKLTLWPTKPTIGSLVWCAAAGGGSGCGGGVRRPALTITLLH